MNVISAVPNQPVTEQLSVQPLADLAGARKLCANVWTLAPGDWSWGRHAHREQEELYLVLDGRLRIEIDGDTAELGPREATVVAAGLGHHCGTRVTNRSSLWPRQRRLRWATPSRPERASSRASLATIGPGQRETPGSGLPVLQSAGSGCVRTTWREMLC